MADPDGGHGTGSRQPGEIDLAPYTIELLPLDPGVFGMREQPRLHVTRKICDHGVLAGHRLSDDEVHRRDSQGFSPAKPCNSSGKNQYPTAKAMHRLLACGS